MHCFMRKLLHREISKYLEPNFSVYLLTGDVQGAIALSCPTGQVQGQNVSLSDVRNVVLAIMIYNV